MRRKAEFDSAALQKMSVKHPALDDEGTISPLNISRTESEVAEKTRSVLLSVLFANSLVFGSDFPKTNVNYDGM